MKDLNELPSVNGRITTIQIICGALMAGVAMFAVVMLLVMSGGDEPIGFKMNPLVIFAIVGAVSAFTMSFVVPGFMAKSDPVDLKKIKSAADAADYALPKIQTMTIVRYALIEGAIFFNLLMFLVTKSLIPVVVAAVGLALMIALFPTKMRIFDKIETMTDYRQRVL